MARNRSGKKKKRGGTAVYILIILLLLAFIIGVIAYSRLGFSKDMADLNDYFSTTSDEQAGVVIDNAVMGAKGLVKDGVPYVEYETVSDYISSRFYVDTNEKVFLYALPDRVIRINPDETKYNNGSEDVETDHPVWTMEGETPYIALDFLEQYSPITAAFADKPNRILIVTQFGDVQAADVKNDSQVRKLAGRKSPILTEVKKGDHLVWIDTVDDWYHVRTDDGFIGYIPQKDVTKLKSEKTSCAYVEPEVQHNLMDKKICLAFDNVTNTTANGLLEDRLTNTTSVREKMVDTVVSQAKSAGVDGLNVDFEKIAAECGPHYIQFIRELSIKCRAEGLVLSVDNYVPKAYNGHYGRKEQGVFADYVVIMGYDEHTYGSEEAGSVASYDFVQDGIEKTITDVPVERVINALPFYTRIWEESATGLTFKAYDMGGAAEAVSKAGAEAAWDDVTHQDYAEWTSDDTTYKVWLENAASIKDKLDLMSGYELAGVGGWRLGQETSDIWPLIAEYLTK